ncbi:hypothetical protein Metev_0174 [Methanohalobium evestigatum Z-7303]|uniref:Uncharacterized protein n=1 Tax=Methanohalobium evestigatum (strain ATCC BAA-1072 / DSM 3721 / NBRC 107634 / OCM 161 / Z-7303) TaxID=644295 RepID=D7E683_METEZ|nr:hypothetical protein [Methanohalobium evestigatum]ADI73105.1 hypothetical protein Metev_0174 [Methanohalobium evestigatum Z-7303]
MTNLEKFKETDKILAEWEEQFEDDFMEICINPGQRINKGDSESGDHGQLKQNLGKGEYGNSK